MRKFARFVLITAWILFAIRTAFIHFFPTYRIRYRVTIDVAANNITYTGSSVIEEDYDTWVKMLPSDTAGNGLASTMHGYVPTVDLGPGGLLFLLDSTRRVVSNDGRATHDFGSIPLSSLPLVFLGDQNAKDFESELASMPSETEFVDIPPSKFPALLHFKNINDPGTAEMPDPRDLSKYLGAGVHFLRARVQMTTAPVTPLPSSWPSWLVENKVVTIGVGSSLIETVLLGKD